MMRGLGFTYRGIGRDWRPAAAGGVRGWGATGARRRSVVSGGAGLIGSHLCEALLDRGLSVLALDNFITGSPDNVRGLLDNPHFEFRQANVNDPIVVDGDVRQLLDFAS